MELSRRVGHPHLAWTYESGLSHGVYYLALEYIPGKNLALVVTHGGPLHVPRAARLMAEVASGLEHAHNQGLIHRDLKPSNIMVTPNDHAKVLDLGLALMQGEEAELSVIGGQGYIVGTMDYIAPEQTTDSTNVDRRADIYSLGCTLYYTLTGQPPFPGGSSRDKVMRHRNEEPAPLRSLAPDVPRGFEQFIQRMMAKDPAQRPPSAAAVEDELCQWATGEPVLPLDRREDPQYEQSIAVLRTAEPSAEYNLPSISGPEVDLSAEIDQAPPALVDRDKVASAGGRLGAGRSGCADGADAVVVGAIVKGTELRESTGLAGWLDAFQATDVAEIDDFPRLIQPRSFRVGERDDGRSHTDQHKLRMPNLVHRPVYKTNSGGNKRPVTKHLDQFSGRHGHSPIEIDYSIGILSHPFRTVYQVWTVRRPFPSDCFGFPQKTPGRHCP